MEGVILGIGNPLLDISANVDHDVYVKYDLKPGDAILAEAKHLPIYDEIAKNYQVEYIAGGAAQNSMRAAQWMLQVPKSVGYIGCVGDDENAQHLRDAAAKDGLTTHYLVTKEKPTGTCAVLVHNKERSLVALLGAAESYKKEHFESEEIKKALNQANIFYCTGFFLTHSPHVIVEMGKFAAAHNKTFCMNIAAPFIIQFFLEQVKSALPYADITFCNEDEASALGDKMGWGSDLPTIAAKLADYEKVNQQRKRIVVFTQGAKQTLLYHDGKVHLFAPILVKKEEIVDTNGAGDSFVGGFLAALAQNKPLEECVHWGHYCAWECIQRSGATYPSHPPKIPSQ